MFTFLNLPCISLEVLNWKNGLFNKVFSVPGCGCAGTNTPELNKTACWAATESDGFV